MVMMMRRILILKVEIMILGVEKLMIMVDDEGGNTIDDGGGDDSDNDDGDCDEVMLVSITLML